MNSIDSAMEDRVEAQHDFVGGGEISAGFTHDMTPELGLEG